MVETEDLTDAARRIVLERAASRPAAAGEHVDVRVPIDGTDEVRSYSVVDSSPDGSRLAVTVLRARESRGGSAYLHRLQPGDTIEAAGPLQNFPLRLGAARYVLLAGGIGITALVEGARLLRSLGLDYVLHYVGRSGAAMAYADDLAELHGERLVRHVDDEETGLDVPALVASVRDSPAPAATELYMCGPIRLMDAVRREWDDCGLPGANLRYETFGNSGWFDPETFVVGIPELGIRTEVGPGRTMLEALAGAGADLMYDCLKGECGLCRMPVAELSGTLDHRDVFLSPAQQSSGNQLCACVTRVVSARPGEVGEVVLRMP